MFEYSIIEYTLSAILQYLGKKLLLSSKDRAPVNFLFTDGGKIIAIEVKGEIINASDFIKRNHSDYRNQTYYYIYGGLGLRMNYNKFYLPNL